jgi:hypothetical protein
MLVKFYACLVLELDPFHTRQKFTFHNHTMQCTTLLDDLIKPCKAIPFALDEDATKEASITVAVENYSPGAA